MQSNLSNLLPGPKQEKLQLQRNRRIGAVSAIVFATVFFNPWSNIYLFALVPVPGIVFAILYLIYSWIMSRKSQDNIAHDTHFFGAIYGFLLPIILNPELLAQFIRMLTKSN